jgi:hypothetical protein
MVKVAAIGLLIKEIKEWEKWMELWISRKNMSNGFFRNDIKHVGNV